MASLKYVRATPNSHSEFSSCRSKAWFREQVQNTGILDELETNDVLKSETEYQGTVQGTLQFEEE